MASNIIICGPPGEILKAMDEELGTLPDSVIRRVELEAPLMKSYTAMLAHYSPDIVVLLLGPSALEEVTQLASLPAAQRPPASVIVSSSSINSSQLMRSSMQAGAMDFIDWPGENRELFESVKKLNFWYHHGQKERFNVSSFLSPKGGAGTSVIAAGVAYALAVVHKQKTLLVDLDFQFGSQYLHFDLDPQKGLKEALDSIDNLDEAALQGYVTKHESGLDVIGMLPSQLILSSEISQERLVRLFDLLNQGYDQVIVDMPSHIDNVFSGIAERLSRIFVVLQPDINNVRFGLKLMHILKSELEIPSDRLGLIVNHTSGRGAITSADMLKALKISLIAEIPNDGSVVATAVNLGVPVIKHAPRSKISKSLIAVSRDLLLSSMPIVEPSSSIDRLVSWIRGIKP